MYMYEYNTHYISCLQRAHTIFKSIGQVESNRIQIIIGDKFNKQLIRRRENVVWKLQSALPVYERGAGVTAVVDGHVVISAPGDLLCLKILKIRLHVQLAHDILAISAIYI